MNIVQKWLRAAEAKRQAEKEQGLGFEAGLTLIEVAAAIGISIILAFVIVIAVTGLFSSAKNSNTVQTLTNISTAANSYYGVSGGTFSGLDAATLSSQATGVTFTTAAPTGTQVTYAVTSSSKGGQVAMFETADAGTGGCVVVADVGQFEADGNAYVTGTIDSSGVYWNEVPTCESSSGLTNFIYTLPGGNSWSPTPPSAS